MTQNRRDFLKIAGCSLLGAAWAVPVGRAVAEAFRAEPAPQGLTAKRWAMVVDVKRCLHKQGCRACIDACHLNHNVPEIADPRKEVKWLWKEPYENAFPNEAHRFTEESLKAQPVLVLCNHCDNPPCVRVCPTQATWKRPDGIVMMDMHRCIGCRYCIVACPYGSRSFNWGDPRPFVKTGIRRDYPTRTKGVVEKCTFCTERIERGRPPACVEACNSLGEPGTMVFGDVEDPGSEVSRILRVRHTVRRKPTLGTEPQVYYVV